MKFSKELKVLYALFTWIIILSISKRVDAMEKKEVLFISSNNPSFVTFNDQVKGLKESLGENVQLQIEYMDLRAFSTKENEENFYNLLKYKLSSYRDFNSVILGDDEALAFAIKYRDELFKEIPMIFFGVSDEDMIEKALKLPNVYGINEVESVYENIELIKRFHKDVKNIIFMDRYDEKWRTKKFLNNCKSKYKDYNFKSVNTRELNVDDIEKLAKTFTKNDAILMFYPVNFKGNEVMTYEEVNRIVYSLSKVPIYNIIDYGIGSGGIGGKTINHFNQGKEAGIIAKGILSGKKLDYKYKDGNIVNQYVFDYNRLKDFNIKEKELPKDSIVINKPIPFFVQYKSIIMPSTILLLGLFSIIIALIFFIINRLKYAKELLKAKQLAEEISQSKGHFISNISHELRTPVTVIMSAMQLIKLKLEREESFNSHSINNNLSIINQNCYRLLRLINNIIDTAKIEGGFMDLKKVNVNAVEVIESIAQSAVPYAETRGLSITFDTTDEEVYMALDPNKIDRIVLNLISNAIKFSKRGGNIEVKLRLKVKDSGIGIEKDKLERIFDKFVQVDESFMRVNEGSGIGLSIVKSFVELHKGEIFVFSKVGVGSEFIIEIPIEIIEDPEIIDFKLEGEEEAVIIQTKVEFSDIYF